MWIRLWQKKVLVVFDDMEDVVLFNALVGNNAWFGPISRIVVISKDMDLLRTCGIEFDRIYPVALPSEELALQIFCRCAFEQDSPPDGFMELATDAAKLTGNLPLALSVLGSSLARLKKEEWEERMPKLRNRIAGQIGKTLRDSYNMLKEEDKAIFRHIACLFNHKTCDYVTRLLEDSKLDVDVGLVTLAERCLIQISENKIIRMHDFLQDMGRQIVCEQSIQEPGEREFLVDSKDICNVLVDGTGTKSVLGIFLNISEIADTFTISKKTFMRMKNLRFLRIYRGVLREETKVILPVQGGEDHMWRQLRLPVWPGGLMRRMLLQKVKDPMWHQLRLLEWWGCSMRRMPSNFRAENLVELIMPDSHLMKLWEGVELLKSLKKMDLRRSKKLKVFPDLSKATNLEELYLEDCCSLVMIPSSISNLKKLRKLDMKRCKMLQGLPTKIDLDSLYSLNLSSFPQISRNISYLYLDDTNIEKVPGWIEDISELNYISMKGSNLKYISPNISKLKHLRVFFSDSDSLVEESWCEDKQCSNLKMKSDNIHSPLSGWSSSRNWKNDVFLSFLGGDVRKTLISHLYKEFNIRRITTFNGDMLVSGDDLATELVRGIRESRIAIVVLSNNYASSSWCLDELVEIVKCGEEIGQKVIPIYYGVEPDHIRTQILDLGKVLKKGYTIYKQQIWVQALTMLNQLKGYYFRDWASEADMIQKVADDISFALNITPKESSDVVGTEMLASRHHYYSLQFLHQKYKWLYGNAKALFRHIACFLNNETYENVMRLLEDSELNVGACLKTLFDESLIQISEERVISMHHELQKMGRDLILGPFINQPAKRQFLMDTSEGCHVFTDQNGDEKVLGISFKVSEIKTSRREERFKGMKKLQFMRMYKESLYGKEVRLHIVKGLNNI